VLESTTRPEAPHDTDLGVYVNIPFCDRVCPYCDFDVEATGPLDLGLERGYIELLLRELDLSRAALDVEGRTLATIYFGGGTPSLLRAASVERVLRRLAEVFRGDPSEVTLELNPGRVECERAPEFRAAGVTRLSVGVQSLHDLTLKRLGRAHRAADALRGLEAARAAGFQSLSVDLIYGVPDQTENELMADLSRVIALGVPHVSAYALTIEPGTPYARAHARGLLRLPTEDEAVQMGLELRSRLAAAGYEQYEISNFARPGHASRHNQRYWLRQDVLGLGVSAASLVGRARFQNVRARPVWQSGLKAGKRALAYAEILSEEEERRETLYLGFRRLEGVSRAAYQRRFGVSPEQHFATELAELRSLDLVCERSGWLQLTEQGLLFADEVFQRFVGR
jgi:oxygen-independent coproporphyrinogen-3 oxidase